MSDALRCSALCCPARPWSRQRDAASAGALSPHAHPELRPCRHGATPCLPPEPPLHMLPPAEGPIKNAEVYRAALRAALAALMGEIPADHEAACKVRCSAAAVRSHAQLRPHAAVPWTLLSLVGSACVGCVCVDVCLAGAGLAGGAGHNRRGPAEPAGPGVGAAGRRAAGGWAGLERLCTPQAAALAAPHLTLFQREGSP